MNDGTVFGEMQHGIVYTPRTGVYGIVFENGRLAVVKTPTGFFLIGGGIESGESREQCLRREFIEETGYRIIPGVYLGQASGYYYSKDFGKHMYGTGYFYEVTLLKIVSEHTEPDHELTFLSADDCLRLLNYDHQRWAVKQYLYNHQLIRLEN